MVPPWGRGSSRGRTHGRNVLSGSSGGCRSRHGDGSSGGHDDNNGGWRCSGGGSRAQVGAAGRGKRRLPHSRPEAMSSACLYHGGDGEVGWKRGFRNDSGMKRREGRGGGGGGGGVVRFK